MVRELRCTGCTAAFPLAEPRQRCPVCAEPIEVAVDVGAARPRPGRTLLDRWAEFLPFERSDPGLSLGEGGTPLVPARSLTTLLRLGQLWLKVEGQNPTGSFKDRGTVAGLQRALDLGFRRVGTVSTGNMAASVAAYAARAGLPCLVLLGADVPPARLGPIVIYGPRLARVAGDYGQLYYESLRLGPTHGVYFINSDDPFRIEGQKTLAFELLEQCDEPPDWIALPVSSGGNLSALLKGQEEWRAAGLVERLPRLLGVQASGCAPIARAFAAGRTEVERWPHPETLAHAIANPFPPSGNRVLRRLDGGAAGQIVSVSDRDMLAAQRLLAEEEGLFAQPEAAAALAGLAQARRAEIIAPGERVVVVLTGHGLKDRSFAEAAPPPGEPVALEALGDLLGEF